MSSWGLSVIVAYENYFLKENNLDEYVVNISKKIIEEIYTPVKTKDPFEEVFRLYKNIGSIKKFPSTWFYEKKYFFWFW